MIIESLANYSDLSRPHFRCGIISNTWCHILVVTSITCYWQRAVLRGTVGLNTEPGSLEGDSSHPAETAGLVGHNVWNQEEGMMRYPTWNSVPRQFQKNNMLHFQGFVFNSFVVPLVGWDGSKRKCAKCGLKNADMARNSLIIGSFDQCATSDVYLEAICRSGTKYIYIYI